MRFLILLVALAIGLATARAPARGAVGLTANFPLPGGKSKSSFSLPVAKTQSSKRDFVKEWAAARQKWGKGVPDDVVSTFGLLDDSKSLLAGGEAMKAERLTRVCKQVELST